MHSRPNESKGSNLGYWKDIWLHTRTIAVGMGITLRYLFKPQEIVTVQYPHEIDPIPERHRGIHYLETDVCILCYQCSRACPVDCIEIEGTRVPNEGFEGAYQGSKGATITKFTVDYGRCIFCNLCIEPCPVDCIHMGKEFDFTGYTRAEMVKNLITDDIFSVPDQKLLNQARKSVLELEEKDKREKEEKKKAAAAAAAAAKAAAPKPAAPAPAAAKPAEAPKPAPEAPKAEAPKPTEPPKPAAEAPKPPEPPKTAEAPKVDAAPAPMPMHVPVPTPAPAPAAPAGIVFEQPLDETGKMRAVHMDGKDAGERESAKKHKKGKK